MPGLSRSGCRITSTYLVILIVFAFRQSVNFPKSPHCLLIDLCNSVPNGVMSGARTHISAKGYSCVYIQTRGMRSILFEHWRACRSMSKQWLRCSSRCMTLSALAMLLLSIVIVSHGFLTDTKDKFAYNTRHIQPFESNSNNESDGKHRTLLHMRRHPVPSLYLPTWLPSNNLCPS